MPTVHLNKDVFEKLVGCKLPLSELKDRISMLGTDLESIEGNEIVVEVFPNRPDMLSEQGLARAFSSFIGVKTGLREYEVKDSGEKVIIHSSVNNVRPFTACAIVKNLTFNDERIREVVQIQEKLHVTYGRKRKKAAIGVYPMEKISFPISFTARKPSEIKFRPLEAVKEMTGLQILSSHPAGREYGHLLEGLDKFPIFVDADCEILSMPPIVNSHTTGKISESTKEVFIECSGFDLATLRICLNIIVSALADMGGEVYSLELDYQGKKEVTPNLEPSKMKVDIDYINKRLGLSLSEKEVKMYLERMGYGYLEGEALIPAYRADIMHQVDLVEDVAIAYGFENFEAEIGRCSTVGSENPFEIFKNKVAEIVVGMGLLEANTINLSSVKNQNELMNANLSLIKLKNALSEDYNVLRSWVLPSLMEVFKVNKHNEYPQAVFTIGTVFKEEKSGKSETGVIENDRIALAVTHERMDYTMLRQILDYLFRSIDCSYSVIEADHPSFIPGRVGRVFVKDKAVAYIGEVHPDVICNWKLDYPVAAFELNLSELYELINESE